VFSALEVCYENALYKFTFDIDIYYYSQYSDITIYNITVLSILKPQF